MIRSFVAAVMVVFAPALAVAQGYPDKPLTMIVPFAAGGSSDVIARIVADELGNVLGQRIVIENVAGAGGSTALTRAARAAPDGYTLVIGNTGTNAAAYTIYPDVKYAPDSFVSIGLVAKTAPIIAGKKDYAGKPIAELIAFAKQNPGKLTLGHAGVGSSNYLICRNFIAAAQIEVTLVSYRGAGPALTDLLGGQIDGVCDTATALSQNIASGSIVGMVVSNPTRLAGLPQVPTSAEAGVAAFQAQGWNAIFLPKGVSPDILSRLNAALKKALLSDTLKKRLAELETLVPDAAEVDGAFVAKLVESETARYRDLLKDKP